MRRLFDSKHLRSIAAVSATALRLCLATDSSANATTATRPFRETGLRTEAAVTV